MSTNRRAKPATNEAKAETSKPRAPIGKRTPRPEAASVVAIATGAAEATKALKAAEPAPAPEPVPAAPASSASREATHQINFKASTSMAKLIADLSAKAGGTRVLFAKLLKDAGHPVSDQDLTALPFGKRRSFDA